HRDAVIETHCIAPGQSPLPGYIHIAQEGQTTRILGSHQGNNVDLVEVWSPVVDSIRAALKRWEKLHLSLNGKRLVAQIVIGGKIQYLTRAQTMPEQIKRAIRKIERTFLWGSETSAPVAMDTVCAPPHEGGMKLIDIESTVDAIGIIDARDYFNLSDARPKWAYVGDVVMKEAMRAEDKARLPSEFHDALLNPVMHQWKPNATKLPNTLKNIERVRKKYDIQICAPQPTKEVRRQMPMWHH
ncbi:hypothetical protein GGG16DRAFT_12747, partial [Schizophyllum commune]